jgi:hypothetical protein
MNFVKVSSSASLLSLVGSYFRCGVVRRTQDELPNAGVLVAHISPVNLVEQLIPTKGPENWAEENGDFSSC